MKSLSLEELNNLVRQAIELTMPDTFWVRAEIAELRVAANGHCYMELVQHDEGDGQQIRARARANIWRNTFAFLRPRFERESGQRLEAGLQVLVEVQVGFHPQYGYALSVSDIDPSYSLGSAARRRREILRQLEEDGVLTMNRELPMPCPVRRVAVVSSASAAGYGDFCKQLEQSGLPFTLKLFPAVMQGVQVEDSVVAALEAVAADAGTWDAVVLIRGGGAVTDLNGYESYALAANVAQFPLPVITGIGHERDETVIDLVAHTPLKTPTAVAAWLIAAWQEQLEAVAAVEQRLRAAVARQLADARLFLLATDKRLSQSASLRLGAEHRRLQSAHTALATAVVRRLASQQTALTLLQSRLSAAPAQLFARHHHTLELAERSLQLADPAHILRQGYSITRQGGKAVRSAAQLTAGTRIVTTFADGEIVSAVESHTPQE